MTCTVLHVPPFPPPPPAHTRRRLEYRPHSICWADIEAEAKTGKTFVSPFPDREGRPVVIMRPR